MIWFALNHKNTRRGQDIQALRGQAHIKRALTIAAAGGHHLLLVGPAGAGKALLARTLPSLLPMTSPPPPFREPSACLDRKALVGDATAPGEVTRAHGGVLFLKDLDTFDLSVVAFLAQAVETHVVSIPAGAEKVMLPVKFILVATIKPCPCGFLGDSAPACRCTADEIARYRQRYREAVRTCFALEVEVPRLGGEILENQPAESSASMRQCVEAARAIQYRRYAEETHLSVNADLRSVDEVQRYCRFDSAGDELLRAALRQLHLTPSQLLRVQGIARTIADLDLAESPMIAARSLAEAILYLPRFAREE